MDKECMNAGSLPKKDKYEIVLRRLDVYMGLQSLGRYVITDPEICHGQPVFRGTRVFVADILEQVASGMDWDAIIEEWRGSITKEAIAEAINLAREAMITHVKELTPESPDQ